MKHKKDLQSSEVRNLQTGEVNESLSSSKDSFSIMMDTLQRPRLLLVDVQWEMELKSIGDYRSDFSTGKYTPDVWYQRLYRYYDVVDGDGHKWQRALMASMISFQPLPFIWVNKLDYIYHIIDGGHRSRVIDGWFRNCIRLPKNTRVFFNGELLNLSEQNWRSIEKYHPKFAEYWKNNYFLYFQKGNNLSDEICSEQFEKLNDNNNIARQEFRTCIISKLNKFILDKSNYESKTALKIFQRDNLIQDKKKWWISKKHSISFPKRGFDEAVAKLFYLVMTNYSLPLKDGEVTKMYFLEKEIEYKNTENPSNTTKTQLEQYKSKVLLILKWIDDLLINDDTKSGALAFTEIVLLLHIKFELEQTNELKIINAKQFLNTYRRLLQSFKTDDMKDWSSKKWQWKNYKGEPTSFAKSLSSITGGHPKEVKEWRGMIANEFIKMLKNKNSQNFGFILTEKKDDKRVYSNTSKVQMASVQDFECMYYEYCGNEVDGIDEAIAGDHSSVSHSKGGKTTIQNGAACCTACNREKSALSHNEFLAVLKLRGLSDEDVNLINIRKSKVEEYATEIV